MRLEMPDGTAVIFQKTDDGQLIVGTQGAREDSQIPKPSAVVVAGDIDDFLQKIRERTVGQDASPVISEVSQDLKDEPTANGCLHCAILNLVGQHADAGRGAEDILSAIANAIAEMIAVCPLEEQRDGLFHDFCRWVEEYLDEILSAVAEGKATERHLH